MEAIRRIVCITRELCFSYQKLHGFFRVLSSSSKLHDFYADSSSNSMQLCKLSSKLHEKMPKKSDLILIRKIWGFLKIVDFGPFFSSQLEAPQKLTIYVRKRLVLWCFSFIQTEASMKQSLLRDSSHVLGQQILKMKPINALELSI